MKIEKLHYINQDMRWNNSYITGQLVIENGVEYFIGDFVSPRREGETKDYVTSHRLKVHNGNRIRISQAGSTTWTYKIPGR